MTRVAVVGHVEWVQFVSVEHYPQRGAVEHAEGAFTHAGGGAVVAAAVLADLGAEVDFFCALGDDDTGDAAEAELTRRGIAVHAVRRHEPTRRVVTMLDGGGERTIVTIGDRLQPAGDDPLAWERLESADGVYLTAGDEGAATRARAARALVATPRFRDTLGDQELMLDALVYSELDDDEAQWAKRFASQTRLMVATQGSKGGRWWGESEGSWPSAPLPGEPRDSYGCGDSFAAGFTFGLADGMEVGAAAAVGARCGAEMLTRVGAP